MSLTATLKKVEEERNELKAANEALVAAHAEKVTELENRIAESDGKIAELDKDSAVKIAEIEAVQVKVADLEKQAGELLEQVAAKQVALEKAEQALADPAFAMLSNGEKPVADGGDAVAPKSKAELLAEYNAIDDPTERGDFRAQYKKELGL